VLQVLLLLLLFSLLLMLLFILLILLLPSLRWSGVRFSGNCARLFVRNWQVRLEDLELSAGTTVAAGGALTAVRCAFRHGLSIT